MKTLVLGGSVFVGRTLVERLVADGHDVAVLNRGRTATDFPQGVEQLTADRTDPDQLTAVLAGRDWDAVFDVSGFVMVAGAGDPTASLTTLLDLLTGQTRRYVYVSSIMAYDQSLVGPIDEPAACWTEDLASDGAGARSYGGFKALVEAELQRRHAADGFPATIVRPAAIYGPRNNIFDMETPMFLRLLQHRPILLPHAGRVTASYGHVADLVDAMVRLASPDVTGDEVEGEVFNITTGDVSTREYVDALAAIVGVEPQIVEVPDTLLAGVTAPAWGHLFSARHHAVLSIDKARRLAGIEPTFGFVDGHRDTYDWFRAQGWAELSGDESFADPLWRASWDFATEAALADAILAGTPDA